MTTIALWPVATLPVVPAKPQRKCLKKLKATGERVAYLGRLAFLAKTDSYAKQTWTSQAQAAWEEYLGHWQDLRKGCVMPSRLRLHLKDASPQLVDKTQVPVSFEPPSMNLAEATPFSWGGIRLGLDCFIHMHELVAIEFLL